MIRKSSRDTNFLSKKKKKIYKNAGNEKKLAHLWNLEGAKERLQLVRADLMEEGSFDDAIMGCHGVFHTASPVLKPSSDPKASYKHLYMIMILHIMRLF